MQGRNITQFCDFMLIITFGKLIFTTNAQIMGGGGGVFFKIIKFGAAPPPPIMLTLYIISNYKIFCINNWGFFDKNLKFMT
jgi:hypothetical protein